MKETINAVIEEITAQGNMLTQELDQKISSIYATSHNTDSTPTAVRKKNMPPITKILFGASGLSIILGLTQSTKWPWWIVAAGSAYLGYKNSTATNPIEQAKGIAMGDSIEAKKSEVETKIVELKRNLSNKWENFMEIKKNEVVNAINNTDISDQQKNEMMEHTFVYEVINIKLVDFKRDLTIAKTIEDINSIITTFAQSMSGAIDSAVANQVAKYRNILNC